MLKIGILGNFFRPDRLGAPSPFGAYYVNKDYVDSFQGLGVCPIIAPYLGSSEEMEAYLDCIDGLLLTGGFDIPSCHFNEEEISGVDFTYDGARAEFELEFLKLVDQRRMEIFAICLGLQMYNVHRGGTLIQDVYQQLGTEIDHNASSKDTRVVSHTVTIEKGSRLRKILGKDLVGVNSSHHQSVGKLGQGLHVTARSEDGIIEAMEDDTGRFLGVQWHPESLSGVLEDQALLFADFVERVRGAS